MAPRGGGSPDDAGVEPSPPANKNNNGEEKEKEKGEEEAKTETNVNEEEGKEMEAAPPSPAAAAASSSSSLFAGLHMAPSHSPPTSPSGPTVPPKEEEDDKDDREKVVVSEMKKEEEEQTQTEDSYKSPAPGEANEKQQPQPQPQQQQEGENQQEHQDQQQGENQDEGDEDDVVVVSKDDAPAPEVADPPPLSATTASAATSLPDAPATPTQPKKKAAKMTKSKQELPVSSSTSTSSPPPPTGPWSVHPATPIKNVDSSLRLLRKFVDRSAPSMPRRAGGTRSTSLFGWVFGTASEWRGGVDGECVEAYADLVKCLSDGDGSGEGDSAQQRQQRQHAAPGSAAEADLVVESILGQSADDSVGKARSAVASFATLIGAWCRASSEGGGGADHSGSESSVVTPDLLCHAIDCAQALVAHGCIDGVLLRSGSGGDETGSSDLGPSSDSEPAPAKEEHATPSDGINSMDAVHVIADAVFSADLSAENAELSVLKFLLTAGCRTAGAAPAPGPPGAGDATAILRGAHLLRAVRTCCHVCLATGSGPNRTTARAALRQLVASVFGRMERTQAAVDVREAAMAAAMAAAASSTAYAKAKAGGSTSDGSGGSDAFPSPDHRDAFLVLRSLCKLSMRSAPPPPPPTPPSSTTTLRGDDGGVGVGAASAHAFPSSPSRSAGSTEDGASGDAKKAAASASSPREETSGGTNDGRPPTTPAAVAPAPAPAVTDPTAAADASLESKILALDLLLHVLDNPSTGPALLKAGPQFHYAVRHYLCVSLLKNCLSDDTTVVNLSLRMFVPLLRHLRSLLKAEIEAFVTNVFFVILDSKNSTVEHKMLVVTLFEEICGDPATLAEIFLNYDCDLSAVDLFQRIVNTLAKIARIGMSGSDEASAEGGMAGSSLHFVAGVGAARAERTRQEHRELRLEAMKALRQILASLHSSIVTPANGRAVGAEASDDVVDGDGKGTAAASSTASPPPPVEQTPPPSESRLSDAGASPPAAAAGSTTGRQTLVQIYDSKKKRREEESRAVLRFNQKPSAGIAYAAQCGHVDGDDPADVARYLLQSKDHLDKTQIGEYLGREAEYQNGFSLRVLHAYVGALDFKGLTFDDAIRYYLSGFRLPGEAQKIDRIMEKFAERYTLQNPSVFPSADVAFILAFSIIMLNTDLHNPAIKEERRMTKEGFIRNNRGICDGGDLPEEVLTSIFDRIQRDPISLKEDDEARERVGEGKGKGAGDQLGIVAALSPSAFFGSHYVEIDKTRESNFQKEKDQIVRNTESLLKRKRRALKHEHGKQHGGKATSGAPSGAEGPKSSVKFVMKFVSAEDTGLRDEYVTPMFDVTWGPALAVFSTAMESANGSVGALAAIATDEEIDQAAENAAAVTEVCLSGFQLAICTAGLCGNDTARGAFVHAMYNFSLLGTGRLMEQGHVRCTQALLQLGRDDGELLGQTWEHVFKALSEVARLHQVFELMARNERAAAAAQRKQRRMEARAARRAAAETSSRTGDESSDSDDESSSNESLFGTDSESYFDDDEMLEDEMDMRMIDEANALSIHEAVPETLIDSLYHRSSSLSHHAVKEYVYQLCRVSRMEISGYGGHVGSQANTIDLTNVHYRQHHTLLTNPGHDGSAGGSGPGGNQPAINSLQKLVEVTHYNMDSRPRLVFSELWSTISSHLTSTALHTNAAVAMYAVDSFRQLSIQFLRRDELGVFEFQRRFLKPLEAVMARSEHVSIKELLLKSVEQIILMFGSDSRQDGKGAGNETESHKDANRQHRGTLRSGWRPVLAVLGLAGHDRDDGIARLGFKMLAEQIQQCFPAETGHPRRVANGDESHGETPLLSERFVDLVNALMMFISGPREELSLSSIDHLVTLSNFLADDTAPLPLVRKRSSSYSAKAVNGASVDDACPISQGQTEELELWWPILLGLSRTIGDQRKEIRIKSLVTLLGIINQHFFPVSVDDEGIQKGGDVMLTPPQHGELQTLQLVFRGVLTPSLEHAETDMSSANSAPPLPHDFTHFVTQPRPGTSSPDSDDGKNSWTGTTFEHMMDGCISICLRSIDIFKNDTLVEEVLAMINSCLLSDSGALAVKGLQRLHQFITKDMVLKDISDDTWATVSHMLRRCLTVRGLPPLMSPSSNNAASSEENGCNGNKTAETDDRYQEQHEDVSMISDFVLEEQVNPCRRYVRSYATMIIGALLSDNTAASSMGLRWHLFLVAGVGEGIKESEQAASIMAANGPDSSMSPNWNPPPPHNLEIAMYERKLMVKSLLHLTSRNDIMGKEGETPPSKMAQTIIKEQSESMLREFVQKENAVSTGGASGEQSLPGSSGRAEVDLMTKIVCGLLEGYNRLDDENLFTLAWLSPMLSSCIQSNDKDVRTIVHALVQRMFDGPLSERIKHADANNASAVQQVA